jgi:hypothetical protein
MNSLSVGDGFKFGCGFMLAGLVAWLVMAILGVIASLVLGMLGIGLGNLFGDLDSLSYLPQLIALI